MANYTLERARYSREAACSPKHRCWVRGIVLCSHHCYDCIYGTVGFEIPWPK